MPHPVIYSGNLQDLLRQYQGKHVMDGECAKLPQFFTDVGWTGRWQPGPRVVDTPHILPGTVIANFKLVNGKLKYPNEHGYHAGLYERTLNRTPYKGMVLMFSMIDQWMGKRPKPIGSRSLPGFTPEYAKAHNILPCDNANDFYIVMVP